jgi:hypothetical protein
MSKEYHEICETAVVLLTNNTSKQAEPEAAGRLHVGQLPG